MRTCPMFRRASALACTVLAVLGLAASPASAGAYYRLWVQAAVASAPTLTPGDNWNGTTSWAGRSVPPVQRDNTQAGVLPFGSQTISAVSSDGGIPLLQVGSTANIYDGEPWVIRNTGGGIDGLWQMQVVDATHVRACNRLTGSVGSYTCSIGSASFTFGSAAAGGTLSYQDEPSANFDAFPYNIVEAGDDQFVCVVPAISAAAGIDHINFTMEGNTVTVIDPSIGITRNWPYGSPGCQGFTIKVDNPASGLVGDAVLYADVVPKVGFDRIISIPLTLNVPGTLTRQIRYVDCTLDPDQDNTAVNGIPVGMTVGGVAGTGAWSNIQYANKANNAGVGGNITKVMAPTESVTLTAGARTGVSWSSARNKLKPGASVVFNGTLLNGMVAGQAYYVSNNNFVAGTSFEITDQPPGSNATTPLVPYGIPQDHPLATSGTASGVTITAAFCLDPTNKPSGSPFANARANVVQPADGPDGAPHSVTMSRPVISMAGNNLRQHDPYAAKTIYKDITADMGKIANFSYKAGGSATTPVLIAFANARMNDPDGPAPPLPSESAALLTPQSYNRGFIKANSTYEFTAMVETIAYAPAHHGTSMCRNCETMFGWDNFAAGGDSNIRMINLHSTRKGTFLGKEYVASENAAIAAVDATTHTEALGNVAYNTSTGCKTAGGKSSISYSGVATNVTVSGISSINKCNLVDTRLVWYGANPKMFKVVAIDDTSGFVLTVPGDATAAPVGTLALVGGDEHSDWVQINRPSPGCDLTTGGGVDGENWTITKYTGPTMFDIDVSGPFNYQGDTSNGMLAQTGNCGTSSNPMTIASDGMSGTVGTAAFFKPGTFIQYNATTIARVADTQAPALATTVNFAYPVRQYSGAAAAGQTWSTWYRTNVIRDVAFINSGWNPLTGGDYAFEYGYIGWLFQNDNFRGGLMAERTDASFTGHSFSIQNSIIGGVSAVTNVIGTTYNNNTAWSAAVVGGTNSSAPGDITFSGLSVNATGGTVKTMGSSPTRNSPWDYNNILRTPASRVGMYN